MDYKTRLAMETFGLTIPFTTDDLTKAFRKLTRENHPSFSHSIEGGNEEKMKEVNEAHLFLKPWATSPEATISSQDHYPQQLLMTDTGKLLSSLGQGLSPQGVTCLDCKGEGYQSYIASVRVGIGLVCEHICPDCNGSGDFTLRSRRIVECRRCRHHGVLPEWYCPKCSGLSRIYTYEDETRYRVCSECKGEGAITVFNPVLQRGSLIL